jgi:hypothetical protein
MGFNIPVGGIPAIGFLAENENGPPGFPGGPSVNRVETVTRR